MKQCKTERNEFYWKPYDVNGIMEEARRRIKAARKEKEMSPSRFLPSVFATKRKDRAILKGGGCN